MFENGNESQELQTQASSDVGVQMQDTNAIDATVSQDGGNAQKNESVNDDSAVYSEKSSFKLVVDNSGRKKVVSNYPLTNVNEDGAKKDLSKEMENQIIPPGQTGVVEGLNKVDVNAQTSQVQVNVAPVQSFSASSSNSQNDQAENEQISPIEYYKKIEDVANKLTLNELGMSQEDLEAAEYSDDKELQDKANAYRAALDFNRNRVIADVERIKQQEVMQKAEFEQAIGEVLAFTQDMRKKEPNFDEIDKFMGARLATMPYAEAVNIVPVIEALQNKTITRDKLPILQKYFEDTRLEYYARKNNAGRVAKLVKPPVVESTGLGNDVLTQKNNVASLGALSYRDKIKAVGQMFSGNK